MRVIFQKEENVPNKEIYAKLRIYDSWESMSKIKPNKFGIVILEGDPCTRNIYIHEPDPLNEYSSKVNPKIKKLSFPYIQYAINYNVVGKGKNKKYFFNGLSQNGLKITFSTQPLTEFNQKIFLSPLDYHNGGLICTPHKYDFGQSFKTVKELINFALSVYWGMIQLVENQMIKEWENKSSEEILKEKILYGIFKVSNLIHPAQLKKMQDYFIKIINLDHSQNSELFYRPKIDESDNPTSIDLKDFK